MKILAIIGTNRGFNKIRESISDHDLNIIHIEPTKHNIERYLIGRSFIGYIKMPCSNNTAYKNDIAEFMSVLKSRVK